MTYAIIQINGKQHKVQENDVLEIDRLTAEEGTEFSIADVLLVNVDGAITVGAPTIAKAKVMAKVTGQGKGDKIRVFKYKSKSRYRRTNGHRQSLSTVVITKISA